MSGADSAPTTAPPASTEGSATLDGSSPPVTEAKSTTQTNAALTALVLGAANAEISAEAAVDGDRANSAPGTAPALNSGVRRAGQVERPLRWRKTAHRRRQRPTPAPASAQIDPDNAATEQTPRDTRSELRDWIKDNATLMSNASLLISISALALNLLPETGVLDPYIKALIFGAALLLLIELHHQWPEDLQIHMLRGTSLPDNHSWRMTGFAFLMQVATLVFVVWATLTNPIILIPLTALAVIVAFRQWYFRRFSGALARGFGIIALIGVLLLSELLMVIVWAAITQQQVTIELWAEERPGFTLEVEP